jgi:hypothetical protein
MFEKGSIAEIFLERALSIRPISIPCFGRTQDLDKAFRLIF